MEIKYYCTECGKEVDGRDMCGWSNSLLCLKCGNTFGRDDSEEIKIVSVPLLLIPLFAAITAVGIYLCGMV